MPTTDKNNDIAYLDSGATSQKPQIVIDSIKKFYEYDNANDQLNLLLQYIQHYPCFQYSDCQF